MVKWRQTTEIRWEFSTRTRRNTNKFCLTTFSKSHRKAATGAAWRWCVWFAVPYWTTQRIVRTLWSISGYVLRVYWYISIRWVLYAVCCTVYLTFVEIFFNFCKKIFHFYQNNHKNEYTIYVTELKQHKLPPVAIDQRQTINIDFNMNYKRVLFTHFFQVVAKDDEKFAACCRNCKLVIRLIHTSCCTALIRHLKVSFLNDFFNKFFFNI